MKGDMAVRKLQIAIYNAVCSNNNDSSEAAREWLCLDRVPHQQEILEPMYGSYIQICRELGINWFDLKNALNDAPRLPGKKPCLRLVQTFELAYYDPHEKTTINCNKRRKIKEVQRELHLSLVPPAKDRSETHKESKNK